MLSFVVSAVWSLVQLVGLALVLFALFVSAVNLFFGSSYRRAVKPSRDDPIELVRRNYHFGIEKTDVDDASAWNGHGRFVSMFLAALSLFFPAGERMFVRSVQYHMKHPDVQKDEKLKIACASFVSQESVHGREHEFYNAQLKLQKPIAHSLERVVELITGGATRVLPYRSVLGATVALEHWTAIMADFLLRHALGPNGGVFGTESARTSRFGLIWQWHACEETEHKAVAYDVFERYYGRGWQAYVSRCLSMLVSGLLFWTLAPVFTICLVAADGQLFNWAGWFQLLQVLLISPGMFWRILPAFCDYFRFDFHPWDHDNVGLIQNVHELERKIKEFQEQDDLIKEGQTTKSVAAGGKNQTPLAISPAAMAAAGIKSGTEIAASASS